MRRSLRTSQNQGSQLYNSRKCLLLKNAGEELLAEVVASRLNESLQEGLEETKYLLAVTAEA